MWLTVFCLGLCLGLALLLMLLYQQYRQRRFLTQLLDNMVRQNSLSASQSIKNIPRLFQPLCAYLDNLQQSLPADLGTDKLTGLLNRVGIKMALAQMSPVTKGSLILLNIYRFRYINDLFGAEISDELLKALADRLRNLKHSATLLARLNGDEFLLYFETPMGKDEINRLKGRLQVPFKIQETSISIRIQFGCLDQTYFHTNVSQMLKRLDLSLKNARKALDFIGFYATGDDQRKHRKLTLIKDMPRGLVENEFFLEFQPKLRLSNGSLFQVEALMRWSHKEFGTITPSEFIPLAEYTGMIELVSRWALTQVLTQQKRWRDQGLHIQVAVNLSTRDLEQADLYQDIAAGLKVFDLPAEVLMLEITESSLMQDTTKAIKTLKHLRDLGIKLAIDDFGTGHSSLAYLKNLPVDEVKIDKAFLTDLQTDPKACEMLTAMVTLVHQLGFKVTVEGVETPNIKQVLETMSVDFLQGQLISQPMAAEQLEAFLGSGNTRIQQ